MCIFSALISVRQTYEERFVYMVSKFCGIRTGLHSHYLFPRLVTLSQTFGFKASLDFIDLFLPLSYKVRCIYVKYQTS